MMDKCPICLEELVTAIGVAVPCGHCYHIECWVNLKNDIKKGETSSSRSIKPPCCLCKRKVRKFHKIYISSSLCDSTTESSEPHPFRNLKANDFEKRIMDLEATLSNQSNLLKRLVPRQKHLESKNVLLMEEKEDLSKQVEELEDENWNLRLDCFDATAKLDRAVTYNEALESKLELSVMENQELKVYSSNLEKRLQASKRKQKVMKHNMKLILQERFQDPHQLKETMELVTRETVVSTAKLEGCKKNELQSFKVRSVKAGRKYGVRKRSKRLPENLFS